VVDASLKAKDMTLQLLSFSRKSGITKTPINVGSIIKQATRLIQTSVPPSIEIRQSIPENIAMACADPTQIQQIMINLCNNAVQAMNANGGIMEISLENMMLDENDALQYNDISPGNYVRISVRDTGCGIPPEIKERVFDPFFTTRDVGKGTGIGLAVVHGIVKNHNGAISIHSEAGKGTCFYILLPSVEEAVVNLKGVYNIC